MQIPVHRMKEKSLFIKWRDISIVPDSIEVAHRHDYYQLMFLQKVKGHHEIDFEKYNSIQNSLHFVGVGRVHKVDFKTAVKGGVLLFPETIFSHSEMDQQLLASLVYLKSGSYPILNLSPSEFKDIMILVKSIKQALQNESLEMSRYLLLALLVQIRDHYLKSHNLNSSKQLDHGLTEFNRLLKEKAKNWNTVQEFSDIIGISTTRLNTLCKTEYNKTALSLLHERKLLEAKRMLVYTQKQVKEIAYDCGFSDVAYFNRFFKKQTSFTPLQFRQKH